MENVSGHTLIWAGARTYLCIQSFEVTFGCYSPWLFVQGGREETN